MSNLYTGGNLALRVTSCAKMQSTCKVTSLFISVAISFIFMLNRLMSSHVNIVPKNYYIYKYYLTEEPRIQVGPTHVVVLAYPRYKTARKIHCFISTRLTSNNSFLCRSGSSFTGKLLSQGEPSTTYFFEPLSGFEEEINKAWSRADYRNASQGKSNTNSC
jgi:hypothetical protein